MKLIKFVKWQWSQWEFWKKWWLASMATFIFGTAVNEPYSTYFTGAGVAMLLFGVFKWIIWESIQDSYNRFKESEQSLFETIKNSDKK